MKRLIGNFENYYQAERLGSYENGLLAKMGKTKIDVPLTNLIYEQGLNLRVVDFGGGLGEHYYSVNWRVKEWIVVETQTKVNAGVGNSILKFTTIIPKDADIVLCSGALQYAPDWRKSLIQLLQTGAKLFIFRRMALGRKEKITLQKSWLSENGGEGGIKDRLIFYPHTTIPKREFMEYIKGTNYIINKGEIKW